MFPYPSGDGLHVGHPKGYTATDVVARAKRMMGFNVLRVMGWDSFGLPAERRAERTGEHPSVITARNIATFKAPAPEARPVVRLGARARDERPALLQVDAVDLRGAVRARPRVSRRGPGQLLPGARHRARERGGPRRQVRRDRRPGREAPDEAVDAARSPQYADRLVEDLDGLDWPNGTLQGAARLDRQVDRRERAVRGRRPRRRRSRCSRRGPTRCSAARTSCSRPSTRSSTRSRPHAQRAAVDAYRAAGRQAQRARSHGRGRRRAEDRRVRPARSRSTRSTASTSRSGSRTTCSRATAPARCSRARRTTSATTRSRRSSALPIVEVVHGGGDVQTRAVHRRRPAREQRVPRRPRQRRTRRRR